jgi:hypothetical protein
MGARACGVRRSPARRPRVFWRFRAGAGAAAGSRGYWAGVFRALCVRRPGESVGRYWRSRSRSRSVRSPASRRQRNWSATRASLPRLPQSGERSRTGRLSKAGSPLAGDSSMRTCCAAALDEAGLRLAAGDRATRFSMLCRAAASAAPCAHCSGARYSRSASSWARTRASTFSGWRTWLWRRWRLAAAALGKRAGQNWQA